MQDTKTNQFKQKYTINPFSQADVKLAKPSNAIPSGENWLFELKYDGYRILAFVEGGKARLLTRNGVDFSKKFFSITQSIEKLAGNRAMVLDGEVVVIDAQGHSNFQMLQNFMTSSQSAPLTYVAFDLLSLDGKDLRNLALQKRKQKLKEILQNCPENIHFSKHSDSFSQQNLHIICQNGFEGIIAKKANSKYSATRNDDWLKIKCQNRQEFVICGYTKTEKSQEGLSSVILGQYDDQKLVYVGKVGTGFSKNQSVQLKNQLDGIKSKNSPFEIHPKGKIGENITWVKPQLVAEVSFSCWTAENLLRHASFKGIRMDKTASQVVEQQPYQIPQTSQKPKNTDENLLRHASFKGTRMDKTASQVVEQQPYQIAKTSQKQKNTDENLLRHASFKGTRMDKTASQVVEQQPYQIPQTSQKSKNGDLVFFDTKITNAAKLLFENPDISKLEVAQYYFQIADRMFPYLKNRLLSLICCPNGISDACFFKKHSVAQGFGVQSTMVTNSSGKKSEYFSLNHPAGILLQVQMNAIEFHTWASTADSVDKPSIMVFDIDPDEDLGILEIRRAALDIKSVLDSLSLTSFVKTSGGKGFHVVVPFRPTANWQVFSGFSKKIAQYLEAEWPDRYTTNVKKINRKGKIYIDWARNTRGATSIAPYSLRARSGAKVSFPISWSQLSTATPDGTTIQNALASLSSATLDPWHSFFDVQQTQQLKQLYKPCHL